MPRLKSLRKSHLPQTLLHFKDNLPDLNFVSLDVFARRFPHNFRLMLGIGKESIFKKRCRHSYKLIFVFALMRAVPCIGYDPQE